MTGRSHALPLLLLLAACATEASEQTASALTRVDSAGVEVVTNRGDLESLPSIALGPPELVIGGASSADGAPLFRVTDVEPLGGGGLAVASSGGHEVFLYGPDGRLVGALGGEGEGPGEFRDLGDVAELEDDSLVALDARSGRLSFFGLDGGIGRSVDVSRLIPRSSWARLHRAGDGLVLAGVASLGALDGIGTARGSAYAFVLSVAGDSLGALGPFPGQEVVRTSVLVGPLVFGATLVTDVRGDRLVVGTTDRPELREVRIDGGLARIIRWPDHERDVTDARMAAYVDSMVRIGSAEQRGALREAYEDLPHADREPAYYDLVVASSGDIWVGDYPGPEGLLPEAPGPARGWLLFDDSGALVGRSTTPAGFRLMAVEGSRAYGVQVDELGTESVVIRPVITP